MRQFLKDKHNNSQINMYTSYKLYIYICLSTFILLARIRFQNQWVNKALLLVGKILDG